MIADLDTLPDFTADPIVLAAAAKLAADSRLDQLGAVRPEPKLCFVAGPVVVVRDCWGEILGRVPVSEIQ